MLFLIERANEAPVLLPLGVVSLDPDCDGCLTLIEPLSIDPASPTERIPVSRCFEYDPYLVQAVEAYATVAPVPPRPMIQRVRTATGTPWGRSARGNA